jgi:hypothetical protein
MKTSIKLLVLPLVAILSMAATFMYTYVTEDIKGTYKTYDDFMKGNLDKTYDRIVKGHNGYVKCDYFLIPKGEKKPDKSWVEQNGKSFSDSFIWGYSDADGFNYRAMVSKEKYFTNFFYVLATGKVWLYACKDVFLTMDKKGKMHAGFDQTGQFNEKYLYMANGPDGELIECSEENLMKMFSDDADISAEVKKEGVYNGHKVFFNDNSASNNLVNVIGWVNEYNKKHK